MRLYAPQYSPLLRELLWRVFFRGQGEAGSHYTILAVLELVYDPRPNAGIIGMSPSAQYIMSE